MATTMTVNLFSQKSIKDLQKQLKGYKKDLKVKCDLLAEVLAEKGVEIAQAHILDLDAVFKGDLFDSIQVEKKGSGIYAVVASDESAFFVEFGTGIVGKNEPYPFELPAGFSWEYATGKTIHKLSDGRFGWFYPGEDGRWYFTEGMPSRPFMTMTAMELRNIVVETAKEVFKELR